MGHDILKNCSMGSSYDSKKNGDYVTAKKGVCLCQIESGIYNYVKYGLKGMQHIKMWGYSWLKNTWLLILPRKKGWGIGILREYMYFPVFRDKRYAIRKINTGMHGCVQLDACNWWEGGG